MPLKLKFIIELAKRAGAKVLLGMDKIKYVKKNDIRDVSTDLDKQTEQLIVTAIQKKFPSHNIIREEGDNIDNQSDYTWIIDPIDGTKYFVNGIKFFTTSIGLWHKNKPVMGVIYNPGTKDCYWAEKNKGAFLNNKKLRVSQRNKLSEAIISIELYKIDQQTQQQKNILYKRLQNIINNFYRFRSFGCGSISLCYLAQGYFDAYFDLTGKEEITDLGAGLIIAKEAGAKITGLDNKFPGLNVNHLVVTNTKIHQDLLKLLNE
ncbi:inositol monophosphatase [Candidatus Parcubacteria bacterium]|nr:inositol monophosphatase [Candidatus Parcubacteria bacterium]